MQDNISIGITICAVHSIVCSKLVLPCRDDIARAIKKLKLLGNGFAIIPVGKRRFVQSVPGELNLDHSTVLQRAEKSSCVSVSMMVTECGWTEMRARKILVSTCPLYCIAICLRCKSFVAV